MTQRLGLHIFFTSLLVVGLAGVLAPAQAATKKSEPVEEVGAVKGATVNLYCTFTYGSKKFSSSGSGVFISERGVILTNAHVAQYFLLPYKDGRMRGTCNVRTGSPARNQYTASVLYISPAWLASSAASPTGTGEHDYALLYVTGGKSTPLAYPKLPLNLTSLPVENEVVAITGYPTEKMSYNSVRTKLKLMTASSTIVSARNYLPAPTADVLGIASSPASAAGMSGGPVTNRQAQVVGLATAISGDKKDPTLRAITTAYINRAIQAESALPLSYYLGSNFAAEEAKVRAGVATSTLTAIKDAMFKKK